MGRRSTGAWTTGESMRIELSFLLKEGFLRKGGITVGTLHWNCRGEPVGHIGIQCTWPLSNESPITLNLIYTTTDRTTGEKEDRNDLVYLDRVPSNLGKGEVVYFVCPASGKRCRILYKAYNSRIWKSREAYRNRLYYNSQQWSKRDSFNGKYWELDGKIEKIYARRVVRTYRGRKTKRFARLEWLEFQQNCADHMRWSPAAMPLGLRRSIFDEDGKVRPLF